MVEKMTIPAMMDSRAAEMVCSHSKKFAAGY
jgi:hypothetical protein